MNYLIQVLLPVRDNDGWLFPDDEYGRVRRELSGRFGGLTAYTRVPAEGVWKPGRREPASRDDIVVFEVMAPDLDAAWWRGYRGELEARFRQGVVVVRALAMRLL